MGKKKRDIKPFLIVGALILALFIFVPGLIDSIGTIFSGEISFCEDSPYAANCICSPNKVKMFNGLSMTCVDKVTLPDTWDFPLETWEEAHAYTRHLLGGLTCESPYSLTTDQSGNINITREGQLISMECRNAHNLLSGQMVWEVFIDPTDGFVHKMVCTEELIEGCPEDIPFRTR